MVSAGVLSFHVLDLPPEGVSVAGEVAFRALDIEADGLFEYPRPLHYALTLAPVQEGVLVRGRLAATVTRVCDRCLEPSEIEVEVAEVCYHVEQVTTPVLDLTESVRDDILLALPQAWICDESCRGLCPGCGRNRNHGHCGCPVEPPEDDGDRDDPWGPLDGLVVHDGR